MKEKRTVLWLDDLREVPEDTLEKEYILVRSFGEFTDWISNNGLPDELDLDHDLGYTTDGKPEKSGMDCLKYAIEFHMASQGASLPKLVIHSANPVGGENMRAYYNSYKRFLIVNN